MSNKKAECLIQAFLLLLIEKNQSVILLFRMIYEINPATTSNKETPNTALSLTLPVA